MTGERSPREMTRNGIVLYAWPPTTDPRGLPEWSPRPTSAVYRVICPYCTAGPYQRCRTVRPYSLGPGRLCYYAHQARIDVAASLIADAVAMTNEWWSDVLNEALTGPLPL